MRYEVKTVKQTVANKKVFLVVSTSFFGDTILTDELCRNIKYYEPNSWVIVMANKPFVDVARYMDGVDEVWCCDKRGEHKKIKGIRRFVQEHKNRYEIEASFIIYGNERGIIISKLLGAKKIYSDRMKFPIKLCLANGRIDYGDLSHIEDKNAYLYSLYSQQPVKELKMCYRVPQEAKRVVDDFLAGRQKLIGINPVTKRVEKDLRVDMVVELVDKIHAAGMTPVLLGAGADGVRYRDSLPERTQKLLLDTVNRFTIPELGAMLERCDGIVTADTGTLHLALSLDVPVVAVYYENDPAWLAKWAPKPIYRHRLVADGDWSADAVWANLTNLLKECAR